MHFTPRRATSIDLCAYELLLHSRHKATTRVVCAEEAEYFPDVDVASFGAGAGSTRRLLAISREVKRFAPDIIVVHQHLRTVFLLSVLHPGTPVVLHRHNYYPPKLSWMSRLVYQAYWRRISSVLFVSEHCRSGFLAHSDYDPGHTFVVPNGLDFSAWTPAAVRDRTVMFAGRAVPEKGGLEAAEATAAALAGAKDWRALFFMAQPEKAPDYMEKVRAALAPLGDRAEILSNAPFEQVKAGFETAAIALVPSVWEEPFGRTAIEAMAGGAALIVPVAAASTR
jgi:glycosyltransferase involved in cell wall biosynthesis